MGSPAFLKLLYSMPVYEFHCESCGEFPELRAIADRNEPAECPNCGESATRMISAPFLAVMHPLQRMAAVRNERSRHQPRVGLGKSCCSGGVCATHRKAPKPKKKNPGEKPALQASTKKYRRPWMLGH
jgi:putative FmdB family regulatory protein